VVRNEKKTCVTDLLNYLIMSDLTRGLPQEHSMKNENIIIHTTADASCALIFAQISSGDKDEAIVGCL